MSKLNIDAYTCCPECDEDIPVSFTFEDGSEYSDIVKVKCQHCGRAFNTDMSISLYINVNGEDKGPTEQYVR